MTMNCDNDSEVGVILPVKNKILPIVHLIFKLTKTHPLVHTFCQKHSRYMFARGKNGSTPATLLKLKLTVRTAINTSKYHF